MMESPERLHRVFQDAFNRHDLESIVALYEPDAVLASVNGPLQGTDAIREQYRKVLAMRPSIELQTLSVSLAGSLAMLHGKWILRATAPDGSEVRSEGRNTETARRQPDGRWLFVIDNPSVPHDKLLPKDVTRTSQATSDRQEHTSTTGTYVKAFLIGGVIIPISLHMLAAESMPWWPDTISLGIAFGACAVLLVGKARSDRETNRRLWSALKTLARNHGSR